MSEISAQFFSSPGETAKPWLAARFVRLDPALPK